MDERIHTQKNLVDTTDRLMSAVAERQKLEKLGSELSAQVIKLNQLIQYFQITPNSLAKNPPAGLRGEVTGVVRDVVEISVGADDGVRKGHKFVVTRPSTGKYIGVIDVIQVNDPNRGLPSRPGESLNDRIQKGDHVKANLVEVRKAAQQSRRSIANRGPTSTRSWLSPAIIVPARRLVDDDERLRLRDQGRPGRMASAGGASGADVPHGIA